MGVSSHFEIKIVFYLIARLFFGSAGARDLGLMTLFITVPAHPRATQVALYLPVIHLKNAVVVDARSTREQSSDVAHIHLKYIQQLVLVGIT